MVVNVPGKLFLMGEYSVIQGDSPALILPTQRTLSVEVKNSASWRFQSDLEASFEAATWDAFYGYAFEDLKKILDALVEVLPSQPLSWTVNSELDDTLHAYGLGSSGAFTVAMIKATYDYLGLALTPLELFKKSAQAQDDDTSSYGDLAVQASMMPVYYQRPKDLLNHLDEVVIQPFEMPLKYLVVHSGQKVKSKPFVHVFFGKIKTPEVKHYIKVINTTIENFMKDPSLVWIKEASEAYIKMASYIDPNIISPVLQDIVDKITLSGGVAKISGAGGGDNVLAFYEDEKTHQALINNLTSYTLL